MTIPKAYKRNAKIKLLYLYKIGYIKRSKYIECMEKLKAV